MLGGLLVWDVRIKNIYIPGTQMTLTLVLIGKKWKRSCLGGVKAKNRGQLVEGI